ncbi:MAG TPA: GNAT family N-acetyltransferase [Methylomirabilota bacterium]|nr:GNAT family N-acetyltransferase [Methylomirabilota bacterium]
MSAFEIFTARTDDEIRRCFPVMVELRPHLEIGTFVERVRRQERDKGFVLAALQVAGLVQSVAGYWVAEFLAWGRILYVDDLVTREDARSQGYGQKLLAWLIERAREAGCDELHLDSGVQRFGAHRFYLRSGMDITCHHFAMKLR